MGTHAIATLACALLVVVGVVANAPPARMHADAANNRNVRWESIPSMGLDDLAMHDGRHPTPLFLAVKGYVFDVSTGRKFYGPGASYSALTGKACSRAVAKTSLELEDLNDNVEDLTKDELEYLDLIFETVYAKKYPIVAYVEGTKFTEHEWGSGPGGEDGEL